MRNAERRSLSGYRPGTGQTRITAGTSLSTTVQSGALPAGLWKDLPEPGRDDTRGDGRNRGRDVAGEDPGDHRNAPPGALPMDAGAAHLHRQETLGEAAPARHPDVVGQT